MRFAFVLLPLAAGALVAAPVPKDFKKKSDLDLFQGSWVVVESTQYGRPSPQSHGIRYVVTGSGIRLYRPESVTDGTITLDEKAGTYTWDLPWGKWAGRYRVTGDDLVMVGRRGQLPPEELKAGPTVEYDVLTRTK